jgi:ubiquitin C-terminal hydrolase
MTSPDLTTNPNHLICGIDNLGNTCYMSATLQCLVHTEPLKELFLSKVNSQGASVIQNGKLTKAFGEVMRQMWQNPAKLYLQPKHIKKVIGCLDKRFKGFNQEDAQELLTYLLKGLHDELSEVSEKKYINMTVDPDDSDEATSKKLWNLVQLSEKSKIFDMFYGQLKTSVTCPKCSFIEKKFEVFNQLTLPVTPDVENEVDLQYCLKQFMSNEITELICDTCNEFSTTNVVSQKTFFKLPKILVIHLKRFEAKNVYNTHQLSKIITSVHFPSAINLSKYQFSYENSTYDLYGYISHHGSSLNFGHCKFVQIV